MLPILIILIALSAYFVIDAILLLKENKLSVKRSRTYAIVLSLAMLGKMIYSYFTGTPIFCDNQVTPTGREFFILTLILIAVLYTLGTVLVAIFKKNAYLTEATHPDNKCKCQKEYIRRKMTYFLMMLVLLFFYLDLKMM
ncbi:MAG: hypothetical protein PHD21_03890 [Flavobacteriales bacterium]|nr:hypothetical protein [Flavobacteriales bacterium]